MTIEILKDPKSYLGRVQSDVGGIRTYKSVSVEDVLEQIILDVQEELES